MWAFILSPNIPYPPSPFASLLSPPPKKQKRKAPMTPPLLLHHNSTTPLHIPNKTTRRFTTTPSKNTNLHLTLAKRHRPLKITNYAGRQNASTSQIDLVRNKDGVYAPKQSNKVVVLWDLDNKPPRGPPFPAALALRRVAEKFGHVIEISAYANRHAFVHVPQWVAEERRERKQLDILERKGVVNVPADSCVCGVCGRKCRTNLDLKKHFKQLHVRERQKKLNRMSSLKGKKRQRFKERFVSGNVKYEEEARRLLTPKVGYGLAAELRRAGVYVKTVEDKPQAADWALKRQIEHSMSRGVDWLFLVSDDSDFSEILRKARDSSLGTVVVGDTDRALGRHADLWVPWIGVENGELTESDLVLNSRSRSRSAGGERDGDGDGVFSVSCIRGGVGGGQGSEFDGVFDEIVAMTEEFDGVMVSAFSEGEEEEDEDYNEDREGLDYVLWDDEG